MKAPSKAILTVFAVCVATTFILSIFRPLYLHLPERKNPAPHLSDSDGDGMPDEWEKKYGLNPLDPTDATADADGDGLTNLQEHLRGTDPRDPGSPGPSIQSKGKPWCTDCSGVTDGSCVVTDRIAVEGCRKRAPGPLFEVLGTLPHPYMRTNVGEIYEKGVWKPIEAPPEVYRGESLVPEPVEPTETLREYREKTGKPGVYYKRGDIEVKPLLPWSGFVPTVFQTTKLRGFDQPLYRYPHQFAFLANSPSEHPYTVEFETRDYDKGLLETAELDVQPQYLQLPSDIVAPLRQLASEVTAGATNPYEQVMSLVNYLRENYKYEENYTKSPPDRDPILWFLFDEKRGVCAQFNSALVLMARSIGIPSRVVAGFYVSPEKGYQIVTPDKAHLWAEVKFRDLGWVQFDATPPKKPQEPPKLKTRTEIRKLSENALKGGTFTVEGVVEDERGGQVSGLSVLIYLKRDKAEKVLSCARGVVENGVFNITCPVGENIEVGDYYVVARTIGDERYEGSESDPKLKILSETSLSLEVPERVIVGREFRAEGVLVEKVTGRFLGGKEVSIQVEGAPARRCTTDENGRFRLVCSLPRQDNFRIRASYEASGYYLRSSVEKTVEAVEMRIEPMTQENLIRGAEIWIRGKAPLSGENVRISFGGIPVGTAVSREGGLFELKFAIPYNQELGPAEIVYSTTDPIYSISQKVSIYARTSLHLRLENLPAAAGENFEVIAALYDDLQRPIAGARLVCAGCEEETDNQGKAVFRVRVPENAGENYEFKISFRGAGYLLPCEQSESVPVRNKFAPSPVPSRTLYLALTGGIVGVVAMVGWFFRKKRKKEPKEAKKAPKPPETPIEILFPEIQNPLPDVWGVGEPLAVEIRLKKGGGPEKAKVRIDGEEREVKLEKGSGALKHQFREKGTHRIEVECGGSSAAREIRIVDYREEIISLFKSVFEPMRERLGLKGEVTPRELVGMAKARIEGIDKESLESLLGVFETATYSPHGVGRKDYERAYLSHNSVSRSLEAKPAEAKPAEGEEHGRKGEKH